MLLAAPADAAKPKRWYVKADAAAGGSGSKRKPFDSLGAVERASKPGQTIVVLPAARGALDGGIALKPRQRLVGSGPPVRTRPWKLPRLTNTSAARNDGDAVVLADGARVENLVIERPHRGGVYGRDVTGVRVTGNDVSGHNTSCTVGFVVLPFKLPTIQPGVHVPIDGLPNGWAGIMIDAERAAGRVRIERNTVHDAECGDGIDMRLSGTADLRATISRNDVTRLKEGPRLSSVLAIGVQTQDRSRLEVDVTHNTQTDIGSEGADAEGIFANLAGSSRLVERVDHNTFARGIGGFSVNGLELVITSGNPTAHMRVSNSTFKHGAGDMIEAINFGDGATMHLELDNVVAAHTHGLGNTQVIPGNNGDCLLVGQSGGGDTTTLKMRDTTLLDCDNNGLTIGNVSSDGAAPGRLVSFEIDNSEIRANRGYNVRVANTARLERLQGRMQNTDLTGSASSNLAFHNLGTTASYTLDFGGGALGSAGGNCIHGRSLLSAELIGYDVAARGNWWGAGGGPALGKLAAVGAGIDAGAPLATAAAACRG